MSESYTGADFQQQASSSKHRRRPIYIAHQKIERSYELKVKLLSSALYCFGPESDKNVSRGKHRRG
jgi:hypothetical protein